jgi:tetratricopeptide (TPR) repeat protein
LAHGLRLRGSLCLGIPDYSAALNSFSQSLVIYELLEEKDQIAKVLVLIGTLYCYMGLYPDALQSFLNAEAVSEQSNIKKSDPSWPYEIKNNIGYTYVMLDDPEKALPYLQKGAESARAADQKENLAIVLDSLSNAFLKMGDFDNALANALASIRNAREAGIVNYLAEYLLTVSSAYIGRHKYAQALESIEESIPLARTHNFRLIEAEGLRKLADVYQHQERNEDALRILRQALSIVQSLGMKQSMYQCLYDLAMVYKKVGDYASAFEYFEKFIK